MRQVDVNGNVLVVFYPIDDKDSTMIGLNYSEGSFLRMLLKERRMEQGAFIGKRMVRSIRWIRFRLTNISCRLLSGLTISVRGIRKIYLSGEVKGLANNCRNQIVSL